MKYNEEFVDRHFELIKIVLIILRSCRIFFIIMFLKYPQIMRWIFIYDSINRIIEAFIPVNYSLMQIYSPILLDICVNYCNDFLLSFFAVNLTIIGTKVVNSYVMADGSSEAILGSLIPAMGFSIIYIFIAVIIGRNYLLIGYSQHQAKLNFKFAFNLREGLVVLYGEENPVRYMNQAALNMLSQKNRYNTDEIKGVNFNECFDVCLQMFRRIQLPGD